MEIMFLGTLILFGQTSYLLGKSNINKPNIRTNGMTVAAMNTIHPKKMANKIPQPSKIIAVKTNDP